MPAPTLVYVYITIVKLTFWETLLVAALSTLDDEGPPCSTVAHANSFYVLCIDSPATARECICMCRCLFVCMCVCQYTYTRTRVCVCVYICVQIYWYMPNSFLCSVLTRLPLPVSSIYMCKCLFLFMWVRVGVCMHVYVCVCVCVCVCVHIYIHMWMHVNSFCIDSPATARASSMYV